MGGTTIRIAVAAALGVALVGGRDAGPAAVGALYLAAVTVPLAVVDAREKRLPNALVVPGYGFVAVGIAWSWLARGSPPGAALLCVVCAFALLGALASGGGIGMGDVKLAGVLAGALAALVAERAPPGDAAGAAGAASAVGVWFVASFAAAGLAGAAELSAGSRGRAAEIPLGPLLLSSFWAVAVLW